MNTTMATAHGSVSRRRLGLVSVWIAIGGFAAMIAVGSIAPAEDTGFWGDLVHFGSFTAYFGFLVFFGLLTVVHVTGAIFGLMAMFRQNDRRLLGLLGILLNVGFLFLEIFLCRAP